MVTVILLVYITGMLGVSVWMHETWDEEDLFLPEAAWLPLMWPALLYLIVSEWIRR